MIRSAEADFLQRLERARNGDRDALDQIFEQVYDELRELAHRVRRGRASPTLNTTALVHEAWLAMARQEQARFDSRQHYFAYAAKAMRHILIDHARQRAAAKRQPGDGITGSVHDGTLGLMAIDQALTRLEALSPRLARVVELRLFAGLSRGEIAALLGVTERSVDRDWLKARALLARWLDGDAQ